MILQRGFKYKLYVNKKQSQLLFNHCFTSNQAWNILISYQRKQFKLNKNKRKLNKKVIKVLIGQD